MPKTRSSAKAKVAPWWLGEGEEECVHCGQTYHLEVEFRCPECDGPSCSHCKQPHAEGHHVCPDCLAAQPGAPESSKG